MNSTYILGLFWILVAGVTQGSFTLPMKFVRSWKWEHLWLVYSLIAFFLLPWLIAVATVPNLNHVLMSTSPGVLARVALFGLGWGAGSVFFGLGVDALGMALGFSMATGIYTAVGAIVPMIVLTPQLLWTQSGLVILAGNAVTIVGVVFQALAGDLRDKEGGAMPVETLNPKVSFSAGLMFCILSGLLSGMLNFSYSFGKPVVEAAQRLGATPQNGLNALWLIALPAGGILNAGYCVYLMQRRRSWQALYCRTRFGDWLQASIMAFLWTSSVIFYGWGADRLGRLGPSLGWSLWNALLIVTTVVCGFLTHEWAGVRGRPLRYLIIGLALLLVATLVLGWGGAGA